MWQMQDADVAADVDVDDETLAIRWSRERESRGRSVRRVPEESDERTDMRSGGMMIHKKRDTESGGVYVERISDRGEAGTWGDVELET